MKTKQFKNDGIIIRKIHENTVGNRYKPISEDLYNDERLNDTELGIMVRALSHSDIYVFNAGSNQKRSGIGERTYQKYITHLQELGYLIKCVKRGGWYWIVCESTKLYTILVECKYVEFNQLKNCWIADISKINYAKTLGNGSLHELTLCNLASCESAPSKSAPSQIAGIPITYLPAEAVEPIIEKDIASLNPSTYDTAPPTVGVTPSHPDNFEKPDVEKPVGYAVGNIYENLKKNEKMEKEKTDPLTAGVTPSQKDFVASIFEDTNDNNSVGNNRITSGKNGHRIIEQWNVKRKVADLKRKYQSSLVHQLTKLNEFDYCIALDGVMVRDNLDFFALGNDINSKIDEYHNDLDR